MKKTSTSKVLNEMLDLDSNIGIHFEIFFKDKHGDYFESDTTPEGFIRQELRNADPKSFERIYDALDHEQAAELYKTVKKYNEAINSAKRQIFFRVRSIKERSGHEYANIATISFSNVSSLGEYIPTVGRLRKADFRGLHLYSALKTLFEKTYDKKFDENIRDNNVFDVVKYWSSDNSPALQPRPDIVLRDDGMIDYFSNLKRDEVRREVSEYVSNIRERVLLLRKYFHGHEPPEDGNDWTDYRFARQLPIFNRIESFLFEGASSAYGQ